MSIEVWLTFVLAATVILVIPGPTIIYVVGQSLAHGRNASLPLSMGVVLGDATCMALSLLGLSALLTIFSAGFLLIKYLGALYLIYLGVKMVLSHSHLGQQHLQTTAFNSKVLFRDVFAVTALNPKVIVFYSAFMPQFVNTEHNIYSQLTLLAVTFLTLALINVLFYSLIASQLSDFIQSTWFRKLFNVSGGMALICAGVYSAAFERK